MSATTLTPVQDPLAALVAATQPQAKAKAGADAGQDRFLTLLVTQMRNQDPLNPLQNSELTSQLAQISTVQGIEKLNATLGLLVNDIGASRALDAANLVGRMVLVAGQGIELADAGGYAGFSLPQAVDQLTVTITDASGQAVHRVELGAQAAGTQTFAWDGMTDAGARAANGAYTFSVSGLAAGKKVVATPLSAALVDGVVPGKDTPTVSLGRLGERPLTDIHRIL